MWEEIIMLTSTTKSMPGDWVTEQLWCFRLSFQKPGSTLPDVEATGTALEGTAPGSQWTLPASIIVSARCDPELLTTMPMGTCKNSIWPFSWSVNIYQTHLEKPNDKRKICIQTPNLYCCQCMCQQCYSNLRRSSIMSLGFSPSWLLHTTGLHTKGNVAPDQGSIPYISCTRGFIMQENHLLLWLHQFE